MTEDQRILLHVLSNRLFGHSCEDVITEAILEEARLQAVSTVVSNDYRVLSNSIRVIHEHAILTQLLDGIPFTTFKGFASASYYPNPMSRVMGDVDFIVDETRIDEAIERLIQAGFVEKQTRHERHRTFRKGSVTFELHSEIKGIPNGNDGIAVDSPEVENKVRLMLSDLIKSAIIVPTEYGEISIPDEFHHGLIMLLHVAGHIITDGGIGLRHLCDWAVYVDRVNITKYKDRFEGIGLWVFACQLTAVSSRFLGLKKLEWVGKWDELFLDQFIEDILKAGNFGFKEPGRRATSEIEKTSLAAITRKRYKAAKNPILLPFFIVFNLLRYGWKIITGEFKVVRFSTIKSAKNRNKLYQKFQLFDLSEQSKKNSESEEKE